jgi:ankyrin repeat protein
VDREEIAMLLMDAGADIDALPGECWSTPLHLAVHFSFFATVEELLKRGALIDVFDSDDSTAIATAAANGDIKTAQLLLSRGADVNTCHEVTPLCAAAKYGHENMVQLLFGKGALVHLETLSGEPPLTNVVSGVVSETRMSDINILIAHGADVPAALEYRHCLKGLDIVTRSLSHY